MKVFVDGIGLFGPGLNGWLASVDVLCGARAYAPAEPLAFNHAILPVTERRRASKSVKLAIDLAGQAIKAAGIDPAEPAVVFASTSGDTEVLTDICAALATEDRLISPMRFHNSVHNAASGYWSIAVGSHQPTNAVALHELTVSAGLLEASTQVVTEDIPVLLAVYDIPFPPPLAAAEPISAIFGASLLMRPERSERSLACLDLSLTGADEVGVGLSQLNDPELEALRTGVTAGRILPLLQALAGNTSVSIILDYIEPSRLRLVVTPLQAVTSKVSP